MKENARICVDAGTEGSRGPRGEEEVVGKVDRNCARNLKCTTIKLKNCGIKKKSRVKKNLV